MVQSPAQTDFVALAKTATSRVFRKMILPMNGSFVHPADPSMRISVDKKFAETLVSNFKKGVCPIVQFPMVDEKNRHVEDPNRNLGQVIDLSYDDNGVYATIDVRKNPDEVGSTILGASAMLNLNYSDTATGQKVGPTLLHVAATNRPYLTNLKPFEEIALSNADTSDGIVVLTPAEPENSMDKDQLLNLLKTEHGIDVADLEARANGSTEIVAALSNVIHAANPDLIALSAEGEDGPDLSDVADGVIALARDSAALREENVGLSAKVETYEKAQAEADVEAAVSAGKILPAQREAMLELRLSNAEMYNRLVPENAIVSLSEDGVTSHERTPNADLDKAAAEIQRLAETAKSIG